jgi:flagellar motor switch/type III secretory pathway protein FliN
MSSSQTSSSSSDLTAPIDPALAPLAPMFDVRCQVEFILGTGAITIRDCLRLEPHSIVRLTQSAGSDLSVKVHNLVIATGEVVIADETTALRVNHISPPAGAEVG